MNNYALMEKKNSKRGEVWGKRYFGFGNTELEELVQKFNGEVSVRKYDMGFIKECIAE